MNKLCGSALAVLALTAATSGCGSPTSPGDKPTTIVFTAQLSPQNEVPPVTNADATGSGNVTITIHDITYRSSGEPNTGIVDFQVTLNNFPLLTKVTAAHIHVGTVGIAGAVVLDTGLTAAGGTTLTTGSGTISRTGIAVDGDLIDAFRAGPSSYYFNVHTQLNGTGAVRGQLVKQ
jgi:hypothetical protein